MSAIKINESLFGHHGHCVTITVRFAKMYEWVGITLNSDYVPFRLNLMANKTLEL